MAPLLPKTWLRLQNFTDFTVFKFNDDTNFFGVNTADDVQNNTLSKIKSGQKLLHTFT